jgi:predicted nucleic acid-binding protein
VTQKDLAEEADALMAGWLERGSRLIAPTLLFYEVGNTLHRYVVHGLLEIDEARDALDAAASFDIELHGDPSLHHRALEIARRFELPSAYDAHYVALAERCDADLWTSDAKLFRKVHPLLPRVNLLAR